MAVFFMKSVQGLEAGSSNLAIHKYAICGDSVLILANYAVEVSCCALLNICSKDHFFVFYSKVPLLYDMENHFI